MSLLWISERDVDRLVTMQEVMEAVEAAFAAHGRGRVQMPAKTYRMNFRK